MARMRILYGNRKTDYIEIGIWEKKIDVGKACQDSLLESLFLLCDILR